MKIAPEPMDKPLWSGSANGNSGVGKSQEIGALDHRSGAISLCID
jgi:hypothetical protein